MAKAKQNVVWQPQPGPQEAAIRASFIEELFFGGAAFGGKSDFLLGDFLSDVDQGAAWSGIIFRQTFPSLEGLIERSMEFYPSTGARWLEGKAEWRWENGATLKFRHMETAADFIKYQGHSYSWIGWDELVEFPPGANGGPSQCYTKMLSRLRGPAKNKRVRATGNPGGVGHQWVQSYFRIPAQMIYLSDVKPFVDAKTKHNVVFVPSRVEDNVIGITEDPGYMDRLEGVGDEELVRAWKLGDWSALVGAFFGGAWDKVDLVDSFDIPQSWRIYSGMDYGEASPTAWIMGAVDYDKNLWLINEYYKADRSASEHASEIRDMVDNYPYCAKKPSMNIADPSMFARRRLSNKEAQVHSASDVFRDHGMHLRPGNNQRVNGWRILRDLMVKGKLKIFSEWCPATIATLPVIPRDPKRPEDVQTDSEDHAADALRYLAVHIFGPGRSKKVKGVSESERVLDSLTPERTGMRYG